jgi:hypothetical protein
MDDDIQSQVVERADVGERRIWPAVLAALVIGLLAGGVIGGARGPDQAEVDALRDRAQRAERQVVFMRGERDRLNGQIADNQVIISEMQLRLAGR